MYFRVFRILFVFSKQMSVLPDGYLGWEGELLILFVNRMLIIAAAAVNDDRDHDWYMFALIGTDSWNMYAHGVQYLVTL